MIITTYNSTVLLESIYLDVPIVAMWKKINFILMQNLKNISIF